MKKGIVITTINHPTKAIKQIANESSKRGFSIVIIGDIKTPDSFFVKGCEYLSLEAQHLNFKDISKALPIGHYSRKNIGYLWAMKNNCDIIHETDDDNFPLDSFWILPQKPEKKVISQKSIWYNAYSFFTDNYIWPRGYPLENIKQQDSHEIINNEDQAIIYQGLADADPDVDAIFRLLFNLPFYFKKNLSILLSKNVWCPFNSQNTVFLKEAFPFLYLPSTCSFRMTDIWRSFIAQRCIWESRKYVAFHSATVVQNRNEHDLLRDFEEEISGYLGNLKIIDILNDLSLSEDPMNNLFICYQALQNKGYFKINELKLVEMWIDNLNKMHV